MYGFTLSMRGYLPHYDTEPCFETLEEASEAMREEVESYVYDYAQWLIESEFDIKNPSDSDFDAAADLAGEWFDGMYYAEVYEDGDTY